MLIQEEMKVWDQLCLDHPGPISDSVQISHGKGPHLVVAALMHGNEVGNLPPLLKIFQEMISGKLKFPGTFTALLGNRPAYLQSKRLLEQDLNRLFAWEGRPCPESHRVEELKKAIAQGDLFIDFHQTILPTKYAFWTVSYSPLIAAWAQALGGSQMFLTRRPGDIFAKGLMTSDEYGRSQGVPSLTVETSASGVTKAGEKIILEILHTAFKILPEMASTRDLIHVGPYAKKNPELKFLVRSHKEDFNHPLLALRPGLVNFDEVKKGEILGTKAGNENILAPEDGYVIFPKYLPRDGQGQVFGPLPSDLYLLYKETSLEELTGEI